MKKAVKGALLALPLVLALLLLVAYFMIGSLVRTAVVTLGPEILGAPVHIERVSVRPLSGKASLSGLRIGNPEGFRTPHAITLGEVRMDVDIGSVRTDTVRIRGIYLDDPDITIEGLAANNLRQLQQNVMAYAGAHGQRPADNEPPAETGSPAAPARKVIIDEVVIAGGQVHYTPGLTLGQTIGVDLPEIRLEGIGTARGGVSVAEALAAVFEQFDVMVQGVTGDLDALAADGVRAAGRGLAERTGLSSNVVEEGLNQALDRVGNLLGRGED